MRRAIAALAVLVAGALPATASAQLPPILAATTTTLQSTGDAVYGEAVTLTATVTTAAGPVTSGTVDFIRNAIPFCENRPLDVQGRATCEATGLPAGLHAFTAAYSGTAGLLLGSVTALPLLETVARAPLTVTADPKTVTYGQVPTGLTATITGAAAGLLTGGAPACSIAPNTPTDARLH